MNPILQRWQEVRAGRGSDPALFAPDGKVLRSFDGIEREAESWREELEKIPARHAVAIQIGNAVEWPALLLACWRAGFVVVPVDIDLRPERRQAVENLCGVRARFERGPDGVRLVPSEALAAPWPENGPDFLKLTSGTTGEPRAVRFTAAQLLADSDAICATMGFGANDRNYGVIAFSHSYGFSNLLTPLLGLGVPLVVASDVMPHAILEGLRVSGATVFPGVPAFFRTLAELAPPPDLALRLCISAGAPLTPEVARRFAERWERKVHSFYGSSECGGICYDTSEAVQIPPGFIGPPLQGVSIEMLSAASPSLIQVRSSAVADGYHPADSSETLGDGKFEPADLLEWNGAGYVIRGRISDIINVAGRKVDPGEIERVLRSAPGVSEVVVLGLPREGRGEEIMACVVGTDTEQTLRLFCAEKLSAWQMPKHWFFLDELPVNARGKLNRAELRALLTASSEL